MKLDNDKKHRYQNRDENQESGVYRDTAELFDGAKRIKLIISKPEIRCQQCDSTRVRKRLIDIPVCDDTILLKRVRVLYCPECTSSTMPQESLDELIERFKLLGMKLDSDTFVVAVNKGLHSYDDKWLKRRSERKVISFYIPTRDGSPAKAQVSLLVSDPLYPILCSLTSEEVRNLLRLQYYDDLEREAKRENRSISQYLKHVLSKITLENSSWQSIAESKEERSKAVVESPSKGIEPETKVITLHPRRAHELSQNLGSLEGYELAADSEAEDERIFLVSEDEKIIGELFFDYIEATLLLKINKDEIGLHSFDLEVRLRDHHVESKHDVRVENDQIPLLEKTRCSINDVEEVLLQLE